MNPKRLLRKLLLACLNTLPPDKTLRFLFSLDRWLYYLQGQIAATYGDGLHTKHRHMGYYRFFTQHLQPGQRVIDIGCGIGAVAYRIVQEVDVNILGIDFNKNSIQKAHERHSDPNIEYRVGDALTDLPNEMFDVVILSNVLEHLPERPKFLRALQTQLCPSYILIRVPLFERDWRVLLKKELGVEWRLDPTHETEYTLESFVEEMTHAGLTIDYQEVRWGEIWAVTSPNREV